MKREMGPPQTPLYPPYNFSVMDMSTQIPYIGVLHIYIYSFNKQRTYDLPDTVLSICKNI